MAIRIKNRMPHPFYTSHASSSHFTHPASFPPHGAPPSSSPCYPHSKASSMARIAWLPYGIGHFKIIFVVVTFLRLFCTRQALYFWARFFGNMNMIGVIIQILLPCSAAWYELIHGLTPTNYSIKGSPGGLARIDALFHSRAFRTLLISCRPTCGPSNLRNHWCPVDVSASFDGGLASSLEVPLTFMTTRPLFPLWVV